VIGKCCGGERQATADRLLGELDAGQNADTVDPSRSSL
jgi:hypothetical protein